MQSQNKHTLTFVWEETRHAFYPMTSQPRARSCREYVLQRTFERSSGQMGNAM